MFTGESFMVVEAAVGIQVQGHLTKAIVVPLTKEVTLPTKEATPSKEATLSKEETPSREETPSLAKEISTLE